MEGRGERVQETGGGQFWLTPKNDSVLSFPFQKHSSCDIQDNYLQNEMQFPYLQFQSIFSALV